MDIAGLKAEMLSHSPSYRSGFIVLANFENERDLYQKEIIDALGKENIACLQFMQEYIMVVTMKNRDIRDYVLVHLRINTFLKDEPTKYLIDPVFPVPAYIEILIKDILRGLAAARMKEIKQGFTELFTEVTNIEMDFVDWDGVTTNAGDILVKGVSRDLEKTLSVINKGKRATLGQIQGQQSGRMAVLGKIEGLVIIRKFCPLKEPKERPGNLSILWNKLPMKIEHDPAVEGINASWH